MQQISAMRYFCLPALQNDKSSKLISILDCSGSMSSYWKYLAQAYNQLIVDLEESQAIVFDHNYKVLPLNIKLSERIQDYGGGGTNITLPFQQFNEYIKREQIISDITVLFISDGAGSFDEKYIEQTLQKVENLNFICLGVGQGFPTKISMSLRKLYHSGDLSIPPLFIVDTNSESDKNISREEHLQNIFINEIFNIKGLLKQKIEVEINPPVFRFPWENQTTTKVFSGSWVTSESEQLQYENLIIQPEVINNEISLLQIAKYWLQNISLLSFQHSVQEEAKVALRELEILFQQIPKQNEQKQKKKTFAQKIIEESQKDKDDELPTILAELKAYSQSFTLAQLNDKDAADRLKIGTKVGKFHSRALKMAGLTTEDFIKAKESFITVLKETQFKGDDGDRSILTLQSQKEILQEEDLIEGLKICQSQYALVTTFPIIGYGIQIKRSNASMIDPYRVEIISLVKIHKYIDSVSLIEKQDHQLVFSIGDNDQEFVNCILPLYTENNTDLIPFFRSQLFHTIMTFVICENADVCFENAYAALLANTLYYLLEKQPQSEWREEMIQLISASYQLAYSKRHQYYIQKLLNNPASALVDFNTQENTTCQDPIFPLLIITSLQKTLNNEQIKQIVERIIIESIGRVFKNVNEEQFINIFIKQQDTNMDQIIKEILSKYNYERIKFYKFKSQINTSLFEDVNQIQKDQYNIEITFNQEDAINILNKSKYSFKGLQSIYQYLLNNEIPLNFLITAIFHSRYQKSPERAENQVIQDENIMKEIIEDIKYKQLQSQLNENLKDQINKVIEKYGLTQQFLDAQDYYRLYRREVPEFLEYILSLRLLFNFNKE